jgi:hypothetical protein
VLTFWLKNPTLRLTQLQPSEPGRYQGSCGWDLYSFAVTRHGNDAIPMFSACTKTGHGHRLISSIAD